MPLNYSLKKDTKGSVSIVHTPGSLLYYMKRKAPCASHSKFFVCGSLSLSLFLKPGWQDKSLSLFYCCSTNPFTQRCSTVSDTRSHVDPSAQNCTICKHIALNLHCRISPLKVQHKKKEEKKKQNTVSESPLMNSFPTALNPEEKQHKAFIVAESGTEGTAV
ncbi:hypothetical protein CRENBAI_026893 [Crenichthys baileyi]|uniref:Uncharacterized protein n=1 Tax=Crenichthys baileyi TaxID=28760 RepID=A0AAV9RCF6_9TELE